ncbi:MAG: hypothetical protein WC755_08100 [Candidatus Woesearchaeota archaeon]|jgi:hypothetical protein
MSPYNSKNYPFTINHFRKAGRKVGIKLSNETKKKMSESAKKRKSSLGEKE